MTPNLITSFRLAAGVAIVGLFYVDTAGALLAIVALLALSGLSDILDGWVARRGKLAKRPDGAAFDPLADDFVILSGLICLLSADAIPLWLVALAVWLRSLLVVIRMVGTIRFEDYAVPRLSTRASVVVLLVGESLLFAGLAVPDSWPWLNDSTFNDLLLGVMATVLVVALVDFVLLTHRRTLLSLFRSGPTPAPPFPASNGGSESVGDRQATGLAIRRN